MSIRNVIARFATIPEARWAGQAFVARKLGVSARTVRMWVNKDRVSARYQRALIALGEEYGITIRAIDLIAEGSSKG